MSLYTVEIGGELQQRLEAQSRRNGEKVNDIIVNLLNKYLTPRHTIQEEELKKGYEETAEINLEWSNLK